ncbi:M3 family metallopeptidase [Brachybacterium hainanense]|uniref:M3 family metallopeptidase n=1 Tax=Brachybacterium hainanense TaxID=1541174 RepID=A0ABV6RDQ7_9MICO
MVTVGSPAPVPGPSGAEAGLDGNPFARASTLPYGMPDFAAIRTAHFRPAFAAGIAEQRALIASLAASTQEPTFATLLEPLEHGSAILRRVSRVFFHLVGADGTPELLEIEKEISPQLAALEDLQHLDAALFARLDALHRAAVAGTAELTAEQRHILERTHQRFLLRGARLDAVRREELAALNQEISQAQTAFSQAVKADLKAAAVHVEDEAQLAGLDAGQKGAARAAAQEAGRDGFLLTLILPTVQPLLSVLEDRSVRERLHRASVERGGRTWELAAQIAALRARRAEMLGFEDFAALAVADRTAALPVAVEDLFGHAIGPAMANLEQERERIAARAAADGITELAPWDWPFYAERIRQEEYAVDRAELAPYFVLDRVLEDGVFRAAGEVYGLRFLEREDLVPPHPQARIWEVREADGTGIGLFIGDYFTRDTKRGGAWMTSLSVQSRREGTSPIVLNTMNVSAPAPGEPALVSLDEVRTMFHEFGHALHGLLSDVEHPSVSGTAVPRDVVEFPSQVNEMWALRPEILEHCARHAVTGESVPPRLVAKVEAASRWGEGFATVEYLAAAVLDWRWHRMGADVVVTDPRAFEAEQLEAAGLAHPLVAPRYRTGYFDHTFSGGYAAGYYSYLWAEAFDADSVAWFEEQLAAGVPLREAGEAFRAGVLGIGGSRDLLEAYREFRGRDRDVRFLLERRGLL